MVSLNDINEEADRKFAPFVVDGVEGGDVVLRNSIRLSENERHQLFELDSKLKAIKKSGGDRLDAALGHARDMMLLVAVGDGGKRLLDALEDDPAKLLALMTMYSEATQVGEASRSES
jgi:hypothetical protein